MNLSGLATKQIEEILGVSDKFVSKWKLINEKQGAAGLLLKYKGSKGLLDKLKRIEVINYISKHQTITLEEVIKYVEDNTGVTYQSRQSYYNLLKAGKMSWHKNQPANPKRNESEIIAKREEIKKNWVKEARK
jgi:putative transposase